MGDVVAFLVKEERQGVGLLGPLGVSDEHLFGTKAHPVERRVYRASVRAIAKMMNPKLADEPTPSAGNCFQ